MAEFRSIKSAMWREDDWFQSLATDERLLFVYLFSNPSASVAGIYRLPLRTIAFESGIPEKRVGEILARFSRDGKAFYESGVVWVRRMREHQLPGALSPKVAVRLRKDIDAIPDCPLKIRYLQAYSNDGYRIDTVSIPVPELTRDTDTDTDTDTETDTEVSANTTPPSTPSAATPPPLDFDAPEKKPRRQTPNGEPDLHQALFGKVAEMCGMDTSHLTRQAASQIAGAAKQLAQAGATVEGLDRFGVWWRRVDWRGKKGQTPTPPQVVIEWPKFSANGSKSGNSVLDRMIEEGLWQPGQPLSQS